MMEVYQVRAPVLEISDRQQCAHKKQVLAKMIDKSGRELFRTQCTNCGRAEPVSARELNEFSKSCAVPINEKLSSEYWQRVTTNENKKREEHAKKWWKWYSDYLRSGTWARRRQAVIKRAGGVCEACGSEKAEQVHHLTYQNVGREPLFELVAVCRACHEQIERSKDEARGQS